MWHPTIGKVRNNNEDPLNQLLSSIQITQNKFARFINGSTLMDKINTEIIYTSQKLLSVNQINAQIKLSKIWKALHQDN